ncbi:hypothetical protein RRG08_038064 [Elysia crispata]|uniref:Secreted protein n=1 Tax=Elysia crispata TaxID=231223 RepID=A0AAE0ZYC5_9GAST|nr:hypothetical protein RRG08_038064 [Elysia crispata]
MVALPWIVWLRLTVTAGMRGLQWSSRSSHPNDPNESSVNKHRKLRCFVAFTVACRNLRSLICLCVAPAGHKLPGILQGLSGHCEKGHTDHSPSWELPLIELNTDRTTLGPSLFPSNLHQCSAIFNPTSWLSDKDEELARN